MNLPIKHNQARSTKNPDKPSGYCIQREQARTDEEQSKSSHFLSCSYPKYMNEYPMTFDEEQEFTLLESYVRKIKDRQTLQKTDQAKLMLDSLLQEDGIC